jgi:hypothetical protein
MEYPAMRDPEENNDCYDGLARAMGCRPDEVSDLIQQHAPWNGSEICESTRAEREAMCEFLLAAKVPDHIVKGIARGEHIRFSSRRALRLSEQVANHPNFAWREGMRVISLNDGLKFRLIGPDEEPRLVTGTLLPNAVEWRVPSALTSRHVPDLDDPATASMLCARWLPNTVFGVALAEALLLLWSAE